MGRHVHAKKDRTTEAVERLERVGSVLGEFFAKIAPLMSAASRGVVTPGSDTMLRSEIQEMKRKLRKI